MANLTLKNVSPYDGEYEFNVEQEYNGHELHLIKKVAGVRLNEIEDAANAGDYDLFVALAVITLWRAGKVKREDAPHVCEFLLEAATGSLKFDFGTDARPPEQQTSDANNENDDSTLTSSNGSSSNGDSPQETIPEPIGLLG